MNLVIIGTYNMKIRIEKDIEKDIWGESLCIPYYPKYNFSLKNTD